MPHQVQSQLPGPAVVRRSNAATLVIALNAMVRVSSLHLPRAVITFTHQHRDDLRAETNFPKVWKPERALARGLGQVAPATLARLLVLKQH